jgi:predicted metal-binding membrane protein
MTGDFTAGAAAATRSDGRSPPQPPEPSRRQRDPSRVPPVSWQGRGGAAGTLQRVLRRDRLIIAAVLGVMTALSWVQMVVGNDIPAGGERLMPCCGAHFGVAFLMWVVMMAGMMIPSVSPMVITHAAIVRRMARGVPFVSSALFLAGYALAWSGFSAVAALAQWTLYRLSLLDARSLSIGPWAGGAVLFAASMFQLSPPKSICLSRCRAPVGFFLTEWREGYAGAVKMGLRHGIFCVACCWLLMAILFAVGIMNIVWGVVITAFVVAERLLPWRRAVVWTGAAVCLIGAFVLLCRAAFEG